MMEDDTWSRRAGRNIQANLEKIRRKETYNSRSRYQRTVQDINRVLAMTGKRCNLSLSLANYQDTALSPTRSRDLLQAAEHFATNIFFPYFSKRLTGLLAEKLPSCIGLSLNYLGQANCTFAIIGFLRKHWPDIPIIVGGGLITTWMRGPAWRNPFSGLIDLLIAGPGEGPLLEFFRSGTSGRQSASRLSGIEGTPLPCSGLHPALCRLIGLLLEKMRLLS